MREKARTLGMDSTQFKEKIKKEAEKNFPQSYLLGAMIEFLADFENVSTKDKDAAIQIITNKLLTNAVIVAACTAQEIAGTSLKIVLPFVGSAAGAVMSGASTATMLYMLLQGHETIARACLTVTKEV